MLLITDISISRTLTLWSGFQCSSYSWCSKYSTTPVLSLDPMPARSRSFSQLTRLSSDKLCSSFWCFVWSTCSPGSLLTSTPIYMKWPLPSPTSFSCGSFQASWFFSLLIGKHAPGSTMKSQSNSLSKMAGLWRNASNSFTCTSDTSKCSLWCSI